MLRRSPLAPLLAVAACAVLTASACSAPPAPASTAAAPPATVLARTQTIPGTQTISASPAPIFTDLAFPAPATGWVLGSARPGHADVWHTGTAGQTWQVQWQGAGSPLSISATDPAHAWALIACPGHKRSCGRELLATADGGGHWRVTATLPRSVNLVRFASDRLGVAISDRCLAEVSPTGCPGQVLVSRDGGARWTPVLSGPAPIFATASAAGQLWAAQTFPSAFGPNGPGASAIRFLTSTDGGRTWHRLGQLASLGPLSPEVQVNLTATPAALTWASVFDSQSCAMHGCALAGLLHSADGGQSWSQVNLADPYPNSCGPDGIVFSAAPDGSAWAAAGRNGAACAPPFGLVYRYGPAGWLALPPWQLTQVSSLVAVSQDVAYTIGEAGTLSRTGDGGATWTQVLPAPAPAGQVDPVSATTALAAQDAADAGAVLRSDNGGRGWSQIAELPGVVTRLDFWSARDGIAASYQSGTSAPWQLWATSDGGAIWEPYGALPGGDTDVYGPWMSANGNGLLLTVTGGNPWQAGGGGGGPPVRVWTTNDYGLNWDRGALLPLGRDSLGGPASFAVYPGPVPGGPDPRTRWAGWLVVDTASFDQRVAATAGGALQLLPASIPASSLQLVSPGTGFAWGLIGTSNPQVSILSLARTTDNGRRWQHDSIRLVIPPSSYAVPLLAFSDASHGWLVLGNATSRTADGGRTWTRS